MNFISILFLYFHPHYMSTSVNVDFTLFPPPHFFLMHFPGKIGNPKLPKHFATCCEPIEFGSALIFSIITINSTNEIMAAYKYTIVISEDNQFLYLLFFYPFGFFFLWATASLQIFTWMDAYTLSSPPPTLLHHSFL